MDDVFSALDHRTSQAILSRLLGSNGVLRVLGTTVVMATHSREYFHPQICTRQLNYIQVDHLALANNVLVLDGKGNVNIRSDAQDMANDSVLIEELRKTKAIVTDDNSQEDVQVSGESVTPPQETPKATTQPPNDPKKLERQRGDIGLYRFYFFSSGVWQYVVWIVMAAINMLWSQMPCTPYTPNPGFAHTVANMVLCRHLPSHLARQGPQR